MAARMHRTCTHACTRACAHRGERPRFAARHAHRTRTARAPHAHCTRTARAPHAHRTRTARAARAPHAHRIRTAHCHAHLVQERKAPKIEVFKLKQEDRRWAEQHGLSGERGAFQGMIARYRLGQPQQPAQALMPPPRVSDSRLSVFVRCRPLLADEARAGGFDVITTGAAEVGAGLVLHEPKTLVDLSKACTHPAHTLHTHLAAAAAPSSGCSPMCLSADCRLEHQLPR